MAACLGAGVGTLQQVGECGTHLCSHLHADRGPLGLGMAWPQPLNNLERQTEMATAAAMRTHSTSQTANPTPRSSLPCRLSCLCAKPVCRVAGGREWRPGYSLGIPGIGGCFYTMQWASWATLESRAASGQRGVRRLQVPCQWLARAGWRTADPDHWHMCGASIQLCQQTLSGGCPFAFCLVLGNTGSPSSLQRRTLRWRGTSEHWARGALR